MIRALLVILAVLIAVLALLLDRPWLYAASAVPLLAAVASLGTRLWAAYRSKNGPGGSSGPTRNESLQDLGIVEVRPQARQNAAQREAPQTARDDAPETASADRAPAAASDADEESDGDARIPNRPPASATPSNEDGGDGTPAPSVASPAPSSADEEISGEDPSNEPDLEDISADAPPSPAPPAEPPTADATTALAAAGITTTDPDDAPVLAPYVQAVRAALGATTVCLLVQEEVVLDYQIAAIASRSPHIHRSGTFSTVEPLLTAGMSRQPVTVRDVDDPEAVREFLGYYREPADVDHIALAPIPRPNEPATYFLLADGLSTETDLGIATARTLMERFADTLTVLLDASDEDDTPSLQIDPMAVQNGITTASEAAAAEAEAAGEDGESLSDEAPDDAPRPRKEIIAEEMDAADDAGRPLALALIHLNRAEAIARSGEAAVASAEDHLRERLEDAAPDCRVTRFGELTFGVFLNGTVDQVEPWAVTLQRELAQETGELEGGASIGIAARANRHTPESLRADATEALREAYETGTVTIVE